MSSKSKHVLTLYACLSSITIISLEPFVTMSFNLLKYQEVVNHFRTWFNTDSFFLTAFSQISCVLDLSRICSNTLFLFSIALLHISWVLCTLRTYSNDQGLFSITLSRSSCFPYWLGICSNDASLFSVAVSHISFILYSSEINPITMDNFNNLFTHLLCPMRIKIMLQ